MQALVPSAARKCQRCICGGGCFTLIGARPRALRFVRFGTVKLVRSGILEPGSRVRVAAIRSKLQAHLAEADRSVVRNQAVLAVLSYKYEKFGF
jgi:hypothetical protein